MPNFRTYTALAVGVAAAFAPVGRSRADVGPFDGVWTVEVHCPSVGDVEGYDWQFPAEVSSNFMSGLYRSATNSAIGHLTGRIHTDGQAHLTMYGRTGPTQRAVGHEQPGTPFRYTVDAHFEANAGAGQRNEQRPCSFAFNRS